jgi:putative alpha-1,2-mannosidase
MSRLRKVHERTAYTAYSIREIYRAENSPLTLMASERIDGMVRALLQDYAGQGASISLLPSTSAAVEPVERGRVQKERSHHPRLSPSRRRAP